MASVSTESGKGKSIDTELNLVPFIDLLSTLVLFLLVTAVWLQISAIPAAVESKGNAAIVASPPKRLMVRLTASGYQLEWPSGLDLGLPLHVSGGMGHTEKLLTVLRQAQKSVVSVGVAADDGVDYGWVVQTIDCAKTAGIKSVALSTN